MLHSIVQASGEKTRISALLVFTTLGCSHIVLAGGESLQIQALPSRIARIRVHSST